MPCSTCATRKNICRWPERNRRCAVRVLNDVDGQSFEFGSANEDKEDGQQVISEWRRMAEGP